MRPLLAFGQIQGSAQLLEEQYLVTLTLTFSIQIFEVPAYNGQKWLDILLQLLFKAKAEYIYNGQS